MPEPITLPFGSEEVLCKRCKKIILLIRDAPRIQEESGCDSTQEICEESSDDDDEDVEESAAQD